MPEPLWLKCFLSLSRHIPATTQHNKKLEHKSSINILPWIIIKANALLHLMQWMWMAWRGMEEGRGVSCFPYFIRKSWKVNRFGSISFYSKSTNISQSKSGKQWKSHFYFLILNKTNGGTNSIFLISTFFVQLHDCIPATKLIAILHDRIVACDKQKKKRKEKKIEGVAEKAISLNLISRRSNMSRSKKEKENIWNALIFLK